MIKKTAVFIYLCAVCMLVGGVPAQEQEPLNYEVSVEAVLLPLFAVDASGGPVYDLKQEELQLYANGRPVEITYFKRYEFKYDKAATQTVPVKEKEEPVVTAPDRMVFIIIDGVFNTTAGVRRSKKIACDLIRRGGGGDRFVIIHNTPGGGLKHLAGPGTDRDHLIKEVEKIVPRRPVWTEDLFSSSPLSDARDERGRGQRHRSGKMEYKMAVNRFAQVLSRFKYVLKTVTMPKIVFLISEGVSNDAFKESSGIEGSGPAGSIYTKKLMKTRFFSHLTEIVKAVNRGGGVIYTVNPQDIKRSVDQGASGEMSLRYLADESGGKYFAGSDTQKIINRIKKATAAYYELAFHIPHRLARSLELSVKCSRKGVRVHTLSHSERNRPYGKMEPVQKKVFALNAVTGGSWSRMLGAVSKTNYRTLGKGNGQLTIEIQLPEEMKNRNLDIFVIHGNRDTEAVDMTFESRQAADRLQLKIRRIKGKVYSFVIIDPADTRCLYNRLK